MWAESVLVVEDDATLGHAITRNLSARGYGAHCVGTVVAALDALQESTPSLVVLDIGLPDGTGWDVLRTLRAGGHHEVPVIVMSALRPNSRLIRELDCLGMLEKPFPMESLVRMVHDYIGPPAQAPAGDIAER
jgi:DNA-binding response OmpR family regulator